MKITKYLIGGLAALALVGCKDKMRELNTNPDTIGSTDPRYLFMNTMQDFDWSGRGYLQTVPQSVGALMQYFTYYNGASTGVYCNEQSMSYSTPGTLGTHYSWWRSVGKGMTTIMNYIDDNLDEVQAQRYQDLRAICGIVKVYEAFRVFQNYGANVYTQAFKAITEGITLPEYDLFDVEMYEALDDELAGYIAVLAQPANENTVALNEYDPIYGYIANPTLGAPSTRSDYETQRTLWKKFGNSYRLYMAWIMKNADGARFNQVLSETLASGVYESADDGAWSFLNGGENNGGPYNCAEAAQTSYNYTLTDNFVSYLKELDDPRLPLLARANDLYAANKALQWIQNYYPDSLQEHWYYNQETEAWEQRNWNGVFDFEADPMLAYQGVSANPADVNLSGPQQFWGVRDFTFRFYAPGYVPNEDNDGLGPWTVTNRGTVSEDFPATCTIYGSDTSFTIQMGSFPQGRYWVAGGGSSYGIVGEGNGNGYDGPIDNRWNIFFRQPIYTYPEFCFMMAYLTNDGANTGKSADEWYNNGVQAAIEEYQMEAVRYGIQVATNTEHTYYTEATGTRYVNPEIVGINDNGVYAIDAAMISNYLQANALSAAADKKEAIVGQMWIYSYRQPQKMWDWWRLTGYPEIVDVNTPAERPTGLYWMQPSTEADGTVLTWPRRGALPQPEAANNTNYNAARDALLNIANYGTMYNETTGRIFWDTQGL
ncbi:SusD/RagB family nutrient-binding outer membrane lipoprotein [Millionella massiliensis]|uniref:SusD/RagB family nutrient-binding outer membrane lipoprotein n=1 Tax=Millionella massiliensis TaxID=1871023 RepID=UPI0024B87070|nr:SusD/RagB family nutrient-binding outer membrane lipoprotein [Millionella massiliensis]